MNEMIIKAFRALGLELEVLDELVYGFDYEGARYLWLANVDDDMLSICMPGIMDQEDVGELEFYKLMDKVNGTFKFVKANAVGDSVWLFYEHELMGEVNYERLIQHMVLHLDQAYRMLLIAGSDDEADHDAEEALSDDVRVVVSDGVRKEVSDDVKTEVSDEGVYSNLIYEMPD